MLRIKTQSKHCVQSRSVQTVFRVSRLAVLLDSTAQIQKSVFKLCVICTAVWLIGCGPASSSLSSVVPFGIDLTGNWVLDASRSDQPPDNREALRRIKAAEIEGKRSASFGSIIYAVQDFPVIAATRLAIDQDASSIGISYGDGQHRDLIWGLQTRAEWRIDAGWEQTRLVVKSVVSHTTGTERYQIEPDGQTLVVDVAIRAGPDRRSFVRTYTKAP